MSGGICRAPDEAVERRGPYSGIVVEKRTTCSSSAMLSGSVATLWTYSLARKDIARPKSMTCAPRPPLNAEFSPDGRWITYTVRGGLALTTIYVEPFPSTGAKTSIPVELGHHAAWSPDGENALLRSRSATRSPASLSRRSRRSALAVRARGLASCPTARPSGCHRNFDVLPDGKRVRLLAS